MRGYQMFYPLIALATMAVAAVRSFGDAVAAAADRFIDFVASAFAPDKLRFAIDGPDAAPRAISRDGLDPSLLSGLRHESRVSRRSADRNI